jgi:hypothetical protein
MSSTLACPATAHPRAALLGAGAGKAKKPLLV